MKRWLEVFTVLSLLVLIILPACGNGKVKTPAPTATPVVTATPTVTPTPTTPVPTTTGTPTTTPAPSGPVKIGGLSAWSGPMAVSGTYFADQIIKLVQQQVKDMGGILGGRDVEVVRYDEQGSTAMAQAGATKLYYDDKVSALVWGGESGTEFDAVAELADQLQILYVALGNVNGMENLKFTVNASVQNPHDWEGPADFINKALKPKTVALLGSDDAQSHKYLSGLKAMLEAAGAQTVYEQYYNQSTIDYTPYLTKIKYVKPDVLFLFTGATETVVSVAKQITDLGGWGDIKVVTTPPGDGAKNLAGAQGWYFWALWLPGQNYPGSIKFENDYKTMFKATPSSNHVYYYNCLWTAIYAIQLAGTDTDRVAIAQAARSGNLEWDTPMGRAHFAPDGSSGLNIIMVQIQDKKLIQVTSQ